MLRIDGSLVEAELRWDERHGFAFDAYTTESQAFQLCQIKPMESGSLGRAPSSLRLVYADRTLTKGPAREALQAIRDVYPQGDPVQEIAVLISIDPIVLAMIARKCMDSFFEQFGQSDGHVVIAMLAAAGSRMADGLGVSFTFASKNVLECEASLLIIVGENGEARAEPIHATVGELLQQGAPASPHFDPAGVSVSSRG